MGRIKHQLNQRRLAFAEAKDILTTERLVETYPALAQYDERSLQILKRQEWRFHHANDPLSGHAEIMEAEPDTPDGTWEFVAPERRPRRHTASESDRVSARAFLERAFAKRLEAKREVTAKRKVERNMSKQAVRLQQRIDATSSQVQVPPFLAQYGTPEVQQAVAEGLSLDDFVQSSR